MFQLELPTNDHYRPWVVQQDVYSPSECAQIAELFQKLPKEEGKASNQVNHQIRKSQIAWMRWSKETDWFFRRFAEVLKACNARHYGFELTHLPAFQLGLYSENDYYGWHIDMSFGRHSTRKLSASILLTDPKEFSGGEIAFLTGKTEKPAQAQGSIVFFPSYVSHCVQKVTKGSRLSAVAWVLGPPLR